MRVRGCVRLQSRLRGTHRARPQTLGSAASRPRTAFPPRLPVHGRSLRDAPPRTPLRFTVHAPAAPPTKLRTTPTVPAISFAHGFLGPPARTQARSARNPTAAHHRHRGCGVSAPCHRWPTMAPLTSSPPCRPPASHDAPHHPPSLRAISFAHCPQAPANATLAPLAHRNRRYELAITPAARFDRRPASSLPLNGPQEIRTLLLPLAVMR